jgi:NADH dehydrogenase/NADH:ubiquinone oxidoreductase subunit G
MNREELLAKIEQTGIDDKEKLANIIESYADSRVTQGIATYKENEGKKNMNDQDRIQELENEIKELKGSLTKSQIDTQIKNELKAQGLFEGLAKYVKIPDDPTKENAIAEAVKILKDDFLKLSQEQIDNKLKGISPPVKGQTPGAGGNDDLVKNYVESKNTGKNAGVPFQGKFKKQGE